MKSMKERKKYHIVKTLSKGRSAVASEFLGAGTVVLVEKAIACAPLDSSTIEGISCKSGCHQHSPTELEMKRASSATGMYSGSLCILASRIITRLVRQNTEVLISVFPLLCNHYSRYSSSQKEGIVACAQIVQRLVLLGNEVSPPSLAFCIEVICKLSSNIFTIVDDNFIEAGIGFFCEASAFNHTCAPNCVQRFDQFTGDIILCTNSDVVGGEELCISYIDSMKPGRLRRKELWNSYHFWCNCTLCYSHDIIDGYVCLNCNTSSHSDEDAVDGIVVCYETYNTHELYQGWLKGARRCNNDVNYRQSIDLIERVINCLPRGDIISNYEGLIVENAPSWKCPRCSSCRTLEDIITYVQQIKQLNKSHTAGHCNPESLKAIVKYYHRCKYILGQLVAPCHYAMMELHKCFRNNLENLISSYDTEASITYGDPCGSIAPRITLSKLRLLRLHLEVSNRCINCLRFCHANLSSRNERFSVESRMKCTDSSRSNILTVSAILNYLNSVLQYSIECRYFYGIGVHATENASQRSSEGRDELIKFAILSIEKLSGYSTSLFQQLEVLYSDSPYMHHQTQQSFLVMREHYQQLLSSI